MIQEEELSIHSLVHLSNIIETEKSALRVLRVIQSRTWWVVAPGELQTQLQAEISELEDELADFVAQHDTIVADLELDDDVLTSEALDVVFAEHNFDRENDDSPEYS